MTRRKSYTTAASQRRNDPFIVEIDGVEVQCANSVDLVDLAPLVEALQGDVEAEGPASTLMSRSAERIKSMRELVAQFAIPDHRERFNGVVKEMAPNELSELIKDLLEEYTGAENPTQPPSSSDPSLTSGSGSTGGAPDGESTPST